MQLHVPSPGPFVPLALAAATLLSWAAIPAPARSELLYKLETECSLKSGPAQPCSVEATNEEGATLYRHTIGEKEELIKITSTPTRMISRQARTPRSSASRWAARMWPST